MIAEPKGKKIVIDPTEEEYYNPPEIEDEDLVDEDGNVFDDYLEDE